MEISTENTRNIRWHVVRGAIDIVELTANLKQIYNSSDFNSNMNVFWDFLEADFTSLSTEDLSIFKDYVAMHWGKEGKSKAALVVSDELGFGMLRMFELLMKSKTLNNIVIFKDIDKAKEWIESE